jgi:soluble lytic murein transglycosylase-like protein
VTKDDQNNSNSSQVISTSKKVKSEILSKNIPKDIKSIADRINDSIKTAAQKYGLPQTLIRSVIKAESNFDVQAVSPAGAQGLMQLMPDTAKELGVKDAFDVESNVDGGSRYLKQMLNQFNGDIKLALAAYNAGPGTVKKYGQIPPFRETQAYVQRVLKYVESAS